MSILVVGSVALDTVETPFGKVVDALGGSATYFSAAASFFAPVRMVAVVGQDFHRSELKFLENKGVDTEGLQVQQGRTFRWHGRYFRDLNTRETLDTQLNVFENFRPVIPDRFKSSQYVFLANIDPELQLGVLRQVNTPKLVAMDTMNFWMKNKPSELQRTIAAVDVLILNDEEVRELAQESNLIKASRIIGRMGPKVVIVKKGEHGALMLAENNHFFAPAYPLEDILDPTGAGDTFAGGFVGYLAKTDLLSQSNFRKAVVYGSILASFCVEEFSLDRLKKLTMEEIEERYSEFIRLTKV